MCKRLFVPFWGLVFACVVYICEHLMSTTLNNNATLCVHSFNKAANRNTMRAPRIRQKQRNFGKKSLKTFKTTKNAEHQSSFKLRLENFSFRFLFGCTLLGIYEMSISSSQSGAFPSFFNF